MPSKKRPQMPSCSEIILARRLGVRSIRRESCTDSMRSLLTDHHELKLCAQTCQRGCLVRQVPRFEVMCPALRYCHQKWIV